MTYVSKNFFVKIKFLAVFFLAASFVNQVFGGALANRFDAHCNPSSYGQDPYPALYDEEERGKWVFSFELSPYYQDAKTSRNWFGNDKALKDPTAATNDANTIDVGIFEERGAWNLLGLFYDIAEEIYNINEVPEGALNAYQDLLPKGFTFRNLKDGTVQTVGALRSGTSAKFEALIGSENWTVEKYKYFVNALEKIAFRETLVKYPSGSAPVSGADITADKYAIYILNTTTGIAERYKNLGAPDYLESPQVAPRYRKRLISSDQDFGRENIEKEDIGFFRPKPDFKRQGVRFKAALTIFPGFKLWAKGGLCEYSVKPIPFSMEGVTYRSSENLVHKSPSAEVATTRGPKPAPENPPAAPTKQSAKDKNAAQIEALQEVIKNQKSLINVEKDLITRQEEIIEKHDNLTKSPNDLVEKENLSLEDIEKKLGTLKSDFDNFLTSNQEEKSKQSQPTNAKTEEPTKSEFFAGEPTRGIEDDNAIKSGFLNPYAFRKVLSDLGLSMEEYREWTFEDTYIAADFAYPFLFRSTEGTDVLKVWPTVSVGLWIPTAKKRKSTEPHHLFRVPMGNDEHMGICIDGALNFDFKDTITLNFGIGITLFDKKTINNFHIKTHPLQKGIYPWKTSVERKLGDTINAHAGMAAHDFIDGASVFCEYSFVSHRADKITILNAKIKALLDDYIDVANAFEDQARDTAWTNQEIHLGMTYQVTQNLELGASLKAHLKGVNVPKTKTVMASMKIAF